MRSDRHMQAAEMPADPSRFPKGRRAGSEAVDHRRGGEEVPSRTLETTT